MLSASTRTSGLGRLVWLSPVSLACHLILRLVGSQLAFAANVKQVLTVLCAVGIFNLTITFTNGLGIVLTLVGGAWYAYVEVKEKQQIKRSGWFDANPREIGVEPLSCNTVDYSHAPTLIESKTTNRLALGILDTLYIAVVLKRKKQK
jgi:hypothetical protein